MVGVAFFLLVTAEIAHNGGRYTIYVRIESHAEIIFQINCLTVRCLFIEVVENLPYLLFLISCG